MKKLQKISLNSNKLTGDVQKLKPGSAFTIVANFSSLPVRLNFIADKDISEPE